jgi:two-component system, OmpR family, sensor histidine kinase KdpD
MGILTRRLHPAIGFAVAVIGVAAATAAIYPLKDVAPTVSLSVVYLPVVLLVSTLWGLPLGLLTSLASAAAFNFFHLPPTDEFTIADSRNWVALVTFTLVAAVASAMAEVARVRTMEADRRRNEADLAAALARELLSGADTPRALATTAHRLSAALGLRSAAIELGTIGGDERRRAWPLHDSDRRQIATLLVPRALDGDTAEKLESQVIPTLEALVAIALRRDAIQAEAVETEALRRSDGVKTALLRAVSHDLRTPLTAIVAAGHALGSGSISLEDRNELSTAVVVEGERLAAMVEKLLDLSKLQGGGAAPRREWVSIEEVVNAARDGLAAQQADVRLSIAADLPELRADAAQLERVFANLLENAIRYSPGAPVAVTAARVGAKVVVSVVDQGPGIPPAERERIFEAFYRSRPAAGPEDDRWPGSGLGLAIAKGFTEANGGTISVESLPGQGTSFVVSLPTEQSREALPTP